MAEFRQGYLDDYSQNSTGVGIGTSSPVDAKLEIVGGTTTQELNVTGIATFGSASGFIEKHTNYTENVNMTSGDSGTLSGEIVVGTGLTMTVGTAVTSSQGSVNNMKVFRLFQPPSGTTNQRPPAKPGSLFYNFDFKTIEFFDGNSWRQVDNRTTRGRGLFAGGESPVVGIIDLIDIHSQGNATSFGNLSVSRRLLQGFSSAIRGLWGGGSTPSNSDVIDYVTIASGGDAIDFGNLTASTDQTAALSSSTRGLVGGGEAPSNVNTISYVEINTLGNSLDFGDLTETKRGHSGMASPTRGLFCGGNTPSSSSVNDMITIASKGNAVKFGDNITKSSGTASSSNATRGIIFGDNKISFVTLASEGDATLFGELSSRVARSMAVASQTRAVIALGNLQPADTNVNIMEFVTMSTSGSSSDFGDLGTTRKSTGGCSDSHGGLGGY